MTRPASGCTHGEAPGDDHLTPPATPKTAARIGATPPPCTVYSTPGANRATRLRASCWIGRSGWREGRQGGGVCVGTERAAMPPLWVGAAREAQGDRD